MAVGLTFLIYLDVILIRQRLLFTLYALFVLLKSFKLKNGNNWNTTRVLTFPPGSYDNWYMY